jgi:uncharacterized protein YjbJ (UPF0337 family)
MNWDQVEGKWDQVVGRLRTKWAKLTDDDWQAVKGRKDMLVGKLQERYGTRREEAEREVDDNIRSL